VTLEAPALAWDGRTVRGNARAEWRDAGLALTDVRPLGSYRIEARGAGGPLEFSVATLQGPLSIAGRGTFAPPAALAFSGEARAEGPNAAALEPLLNLLGPRRADGARSLEWRGAPQPGPPRT
jgi:general secretion pathway protein N